MKTLPFRKLSTGVSLIDVMISVAVLATGMLAMAALQASLVRAGAESRTRSQAVAVAEGVLGALRSRVDADVDNYTNLDDATWAGIVNDATLTAPTQGTYRENFTVTADVSRFVLRETTAECGAGNVPCFRDATVADTFDAADPEFKQVTATVSWTDAGNQAHSIQLVDVFSSLPSANSDLLVDRDLSGTPRNAAGPSVNIPIPDEVGIIPIGIGDGRETAATNPKPVIDTRSGVPTTRFDVLTYRNETTSAQVQRRVENNVLACTCKFGPPIVTDADADFFTEPVRPSFWNGTRYATPTFAVDDKVTHPQSWGAPDATQSSLCDDCCRDHHDPAGATNKVSPLLTEHEHFGLDEDGNVDLDAGPVESGLYAESCRMIRVDGIWRVAADFRLEQMGLLKTTAADGKQAGDPAPDETATSAYENFAKQLVLARSNPPTGPSSLSEAQIEGLVDSNGLNAPSKILLTQPTTDIRFLHNRAFYYDFLEKPARDFLAAQIADCSESDVVLCVLPFVPITSLNATELAAWGRADENIVVEGQAGLVTAFDTRRGTIVTDVAGGRVRPNDGGEEEHPDGTESTALVGMSRTNRGLLALSFPGEGVNPTDASESLSDSQLFVYSSGATADRDQDGSPDELDNCPTVANPDQLNTDQSLPTGGDGEGDACDIDDDDDGFADTGDSCPVTPNSGVDEDKDEIDDACDPSPDMDRDTILDGFDNCPMTENTDQADTNGNGIGDACERDTDGDGVFDHKDNCIEVANSGQEDEDNDGIGDACDTPPVSSADFSVQVAITGDNLGVRSPKPRVFWTANATLNPCQTSVSPTDSDPNPFACDNAVAPSPLLVIDRYNKVVTAGPTNQQVANPCRDTNSSIPRGPAKVFPATCYNYALTSLTQNGNAVDLTGAQVQNPGQAGETDVSSTESTSISLSNLVQGDSFSATFTLQGTPTSLMTVTGGYVCSSANNEPEFNFSACPQ